MYDEDENENEYEKMEVGDERRKDVFWIMAALGLFVALKGLALVLGLAAGLK